MMILHVESIPIPLKLTKSITHPVHEYLLNPWTNPLASLTVFSYLTRAKCIKVSEAWHLI